MRIGTRLWISIGVTILAVLGVGAGVRLEDERDLLMQTTMEDRRFFGEAIASLLTRTPVPDALGLASHLADHLRARGLPVEVTSPRLATLSARLDQPEREVLQRGEVATSASYDGTATTYVPWTYAGQSYVLVFAEAGGSHRDFLRTSMLHSVVSALVLALVLGAVVWLLTGRLVSTPLSKLGENARRLAAGDLSARISVQGNDELSEFAHELNTMAERLEVAQKQLEEQTSARVMLLEQLRHADRLRMVGLLSSSLAHELGTPLNVVSGHARLIERDAEVDEKVRTRAHVIAEQVQRMKAILQNVLGFARREVIKRTRIALVDVAERAMQMLEPMAKKNGVAMTIEAREAGFVIGDENQILQALTNLMVNAIHAMPHGGPLTLCVARDDRTDARVGATQGPFATLSVSDRGTGVDAEHLPHLFEPFFTTKPSSEGTGLGLSVVSGIVQEHGGFIDVQSDLGKGSTFTIHVPLDSERGSATA